MRVLIVEDDALVLKATKRQLETKGWEVDTATSTPWPEDIKADVVLADWTPYGRDTVLAAREAGVRTVVYTGGTTYPAMLACVPVLQKPVEHPLGKVCVVHEGSLDNSSPSPTTSARARISTSWIMSSVSSLLEAML